MNTAKGKAVEMPQRKLFEAESIIFKEGDEGEEAYIVESGRVSIFKFNEAGEECILGVIKDRGIFGEMALIDDHPRMAWARAEEDTICLVMGKHKLKEMVDKAPKGLTIIISTLLKNIRAMGHELAEARAIIERHEPR